jgi:hypothetical protein
MEDWEKPLFHYLVRCTLMDMATGTRVSSGIGEANSYESKHRYRWIPENQLPVGVDREMTKKKGGMQTFFEPAFAIERGETTGQYGKPIEHWQMFRDAIANKTAKAAVRKTKKGSDMEGFEVAVDTTLYQLPNPDIFDVVNTLVKMAKKRALVDATLSAGRLSELFTQDLEDLTDEPVEAPAATATERSTLKAPAAEAHKPKRNRDEFDPEAPAPAEDDPLDQARRSGEPATPPEPAGGCTLQQLEKFAKAKADLEALGVQEPTIWKGVYKTAGREIAEPSELDMAEMEGLLKYMHNWKKALQAEIAREEKANVKK